MTFFKKKKKKSPAQEYREFIRYSVQSGEFFRDSFDWYIFRYVSPLCDRTWLFFTTISGAIISYLLFIMIVNAFPIVEKVPIIVTAKDTVLYYPKITHLRDSKDLKTIEEAVIKYLLVSYLKQREEYNFIKLTTNDLNQKFDIIKNNSTPSEFRRFKSFVGLNNKNSPIRDFGKNVTRKVAIQSFSFKRELNKDFISQAKNFVYTELPSQANIGYTLTLSGGGRTIRRNYVARVSFKFSRINNKNLDEEIAFQVSEYKLFINNRSKKK
jgi:type IV secretory pathway component VirB8